MGIKNQPIYPLVVAGLVFLLGFGTMNLFWFLGTWNPDLYGLYFFKSATFGDAIILPLITYYSLHIIHQHNFTFRQILSILFAGLIGLCGGLFLQYQWLTSETTVLNWTIPEPHVFNVAGWYHAIFLCAMVAIFAALSMAVLICAVTTKKRGIPLNVLYTRILILLPAFPIFNLNDFATNDTPPTQIMATAVGPLLASIVVGLWFGLHSVRRWIPELIIFGLFWTSLVVVHSYVPNFSSFENLLLISFTALSAIFPLSLTNIIGIKYIALTVLANFSSILICLSSIVWYGQIKPTENNEFFLLIFATLVFILSSIANTTLALVLAPKEDIPFQTSKPFRQLIVRSMQNTLIVLFIPVFGIYLYLNTTSRTFEAYSVLWSVFAAIGLLFVKSSWNELIKLEDEEALYWGSKAPEFLRYKIKTKRIFVWGWSIPVLLDMFIVYMATDLKALSAIDSHTNFSVPYLLESLTASGVIFIIAIAAHVIKNNIIMLRVGILCSLLITIYLGLLSFSRFFLVLNQINASDLSFLFALCVLLPTIAVFCFAFGSIYFNVFRLRGNNTNFQPILLSLQVGLFSAFQTLFSVTSILSFENFHILIGALGLLSVTAYPHFSLSFINDKNRDKFVTITSTNDAVIQDAIHTTVLASIVILYPSAVLMSSFEISTALVRIISLFGILVVMLQWVLKNNILHLERTKKFLQEKPERVTNLGMEVEDFLKRFTLHLNLQNISACVMLIPLIPVLLSQIDTDSVSDTLSFNIHK